MFEFIKYISILNKDSPRKVQLLNYFPSIMGKKPPKPPNLPCVMRKVNPRLVKSWINCD